jgi:uncharacterized protein YuzE
VKMNYDGRGDTLSILMSKGRIMRAEEHGPIIANFDRNGKLVELEILSASKVFGDFLSALMRAKPGSKMIEVTA